jgi:choline dehydrogenase
VTYSSGLAAGGREDMILIGFNHRGLGEAGMPSGTGAVAGLVYNAFSRGNLRLASPDPVVDPTVDENMLDDPRDRVRMRDAVRRIAGLVTHPALAGIAETIKFHDTATPFGAAAALPEDALDELMPNQAADTASTWPARAG